MFRHATSSSTSTPHRPARADIPNPQHDDDDTVLTKNESRSLPSNYGKDKKSMSSSPTNRHDEFHPPLHRHSSRLLPDVVANYSVPSTPRHPRRQPDANDTSQSNAPTNTDLSSSARHLPRRRRLLSFFFLSSIRLAASWSPPPPRRSHASSSIAPSSSHPSERSNVRLRDLEERLRSLLPLIEHDPNDAAEYRRVRDETLTILREMTALDAADEAFRLVSARAFSPPHRDVQRLDLGMKALELQLRSGNGTAPRGIWLQALRASTKVCSSMAFEEDRSMSSIVTISARPTTTDDDDGGERIAPADAAFRILQRLVTGRGVRVSATRLPPLDERDFNMVLHAYAVASADRMDAARRVVALQERTGRAPPLSPVAYSILLKAYGRKGDVENVEATISHAEQRGVVPDIVMANTVLDAYVNCGSVGKAEELFRSIAGNDRPSAGNGEYWPRLYLNIRTYNIMLKGMATEGRLDDALALSDAMRADGIWDDIATNTLVKVAVTAQEFAVAESILANHTSTDISPKQTDHPNVEAYTELIDGYAKDNQLEKALEIMQLMQHRGVTPNEYTYTCIVGALARNNKVRQAKKMMDYVTNLHFPSSKRGRKVLTPTYNAFLSGLLSTDGAVDRINAEGQSHSLNILEAFHTLNEMEKMNIHPNVVTATLLVDGLANCNPPRCKEAEELVQHLERSTKAEHKEAYTRAASEANPNRISPTNAKIATALIRAYGRANDVDSAADAFRRISHPDVVALNALLDACCRCGRLRLAFELFEKYASFEKWREDDFVVDVGANGEETRRRPIKPDVVTYTTLIAAILQLKNKKASKRASRLYEEMKQRWRISPDTVLIDKILVAMTNGGPRGFETDDIQFTLTALRDGDRLQWDGEQYQKRKKAVRSVLMACSSEVWKKDGGSEPLETEDPLFLKKGWNKIDSGFRLWGGGNDSGGDGITSEGGKERSVDSFLASKGWNDIDSGFRIL
ncbi:hypothetical protein ACHAW6_010795 [Cyclotella cf. meneghiniana]